MRLRMEPLKGRKGESVVYLLARHELYEEHNAWRRSRAALYFRLMERLHTEPWCPNPRRRKTQAERFLDNFN